MADTDIEELRLHIAVLETKITAQETQIADIQEQIEERPSHVEIREQLDFVNNQIEKSRESIGAKADKMILISESQKRMALIGTVVVGVVATLVTVIGVCLKLWFWLYGIF